MADFDSGSSTRPDKNQTHHRLVLMKGEHSWQFRWNDGSEHALVSAVSDLAADKSVEFDWFDAAMVRHQLATTLQGGSTSGE